jgi:hypothetical protein
MKDRERLTALDWMFEQFDSFQKRYAVVETNDAAERLPLPQAKVVIEGTPEKQAAYYRRLLGLAQQRNFVFVISFIHQDYDALWEKIKASCPELFMAWRDCGLLDENGQARPACRVWKEYFSLPLAKESRAALLNRHRIGRRMEYHRAKPNDRIKYGTLSPNVLERFGYSCRGAPCINGPSR